MADTPGRRYSGRDARRKVDTFVRRLRLLVRGGGRCGFSKSSEVVLLCYAIHLKSQSDLIAIRVCVI